MMNGINAIKKVMSPFLASAMFISLLPAVSYADDSADIEAALDDIVISDSVSDDFALPADGGNGVSISWSSSDKSAVLPVNGTAYVLSDLASKDVVLTATATKGEEEQTREFNVNVQPFTYTGEYIENEDFESVTELDPDTWRLDADNMTNTSDENGANYMGLGSDGENTVYKIKRTDNSADGAKKSYIHYNKDGLPAEARIVYETKVLAAQQPKNSGGNDIFLNHWWCRDMANTVGKYSGFAAAYVGGANGIQIKATLDAAPNTARAESELNSWTTLTFDVRSGIGMFDAYVDNKQVADDYQMRAMGAPLKHLAFGFDGNTTGEVWLDDLRIYEYPKGVDELLQNENFGVADTENVESDLILPSVSEGELLWVSSDPEVISETGKVDRTKVEGEKETIYLYAIISNKGARSAKEYSFTVLKGEPEEPSILEELNIDEIVGDQSKDALVRGFELPQTVSTGEHITWSSSDTSVIEIEDNKSCKIKPGETSKTAKLIASITVGGKEQTREFIVGVAKAEPISGEIDFEEIVGQDTNNVINDFTLPSVSKSGYSVTWKTSNDESLFIYDGTAYVIRKADPTPVTITAAIDNNGAVTETEYDITIAKVEDVTDFLVDEDFEDVEIGALPENTAYNQWGKDLTVVEGNPNIQIGVEEENEENKVMNIFHINPDGNQHSLLHINFNTPKRGSVVIEYRYKYVLTGGQGKDTNANIWINATTGYNAAPSGNFVKFPFNDAFVVAQMGGNQSHRENYDGGNWHTVKAVLNLDDGIFDMYLDGNKVCENDPKIEGDGAMRIQAGFDRGSAGHCWLDDVKVYMDPVSIVKNYAASIDLGDISNVVKDLEIPEKTPLGDADILWVSSNPEVISTTGKVNNPKEGNDIPVTLWALVESDGIRSIKRFDVNVARVKSDDESVEADFEDLSLPYYGLCLEKSLNLPTVGALGSTITWESSHPEIISPSGEVNRIPFDNENITEVTLTATVSKGNAEPKTKSFTISVPERNYVLDADVSGSSDRVNKRFEFVKDNKADTSWAPAENDKKPYLTIELKQAETVNRIILNGSAGNVSVSYRANNSSTYYRLGEGTDLKFSPKEVKAVKFEFTDAPEISSIGIYYALSDKEAVEADMEALNLGNLSRVVSDIVIPEKGSVCGSTITAKSSDTEYLSDTGKVTRPTGSNKTVTLTLTFTYGSYSDEKEYKITILKKETGGGGGGGGGSYSGGGGMPTVTVPGPVATSTPKPEEPSESEKFSDLDDVSWAREQILSLAERNIINGNDGRFEPNRSISREEFVKIVLGALGVSVDGADCSFEDVPEDSWYYGYVAKANELGIVNGISNEKFGTGQPITRGDMAVILDRAFDLAADPNNEVSFEDENEIPDYAADSVKTLSSLGIINGFDDGCFKPSEQASRAQAAVVIYNILAL